VSLAHSGMNPSEASTTSSSGLRFPGVPKPRVSVPQMTWFPKMWIWGSATRAVSFLFRRLKGLVFVESAFGCFVVLVSCMVKFLRDGLRRLYCDEWRALYSSRILLRKKLIFNGVRYAAAAIAHLDKRNAPNMANHFWDWFIYPLPCRPNMRFVSYIFSNSSTRTMPHQTTGVEADALWESALHSWLIL